MRYSPKQYAESWWDLKREPEGKDNQGLMNKFLRVIQKRGDWKKIGLILREIEKLYLISSHTLKVDIESPVPLSSSIKDKIISILGKPVLFREKIEPELLAGVKILINNETLIEATAKRKLDEMFS